jgi:hypothetical protein
VSEITKFIELGTILTFLAAASDANLLMYSS